MTFEEIKALDHQYVMQSYGRFDVAVDHGRGATLWDTQGREYIDFTSGIGVCSLGYADEGWVNAITEQAGKLGHISNLFYAEPYVKAAEKLCRKAGMSNVFFANSGAEANEGMFKLARKIGNASGRNEIISMDNSFHGRTLATLAATGRAKYRKGFEPDMPGFRQVPFNDIEALKNAVNDKTCAVVLEPVQGEGGILPADLEYLKQVRALCDEKGILLLFDEVQCGMGRIGTRFAWQSFGVEPDAFSMAKAIANGLPMGGFITKRKYADTLTPGTHASTFGGTALVSAAALAVQEAFDNEGVLENCREQGEYLRRQLGELGKKYPFVKGVRGMGLMIGVVLDREAATLAGLCLKRNLVVLTAGETVLRLLPPLNLTRAEADEGIGKIAAALEELNAAIQEG